MVPGKKRHLSMIRLSTGLIPKTSGHLKHTMLMTVMAMTLAKTGSTGKTATHMQIVMLMIGMMATPTSVMKHLLQSS